MFSTKTIQIKPAEFLSSSEIHTDTVLILNEFLPRL